MIKVKIPLALLGMTGRRRIVELEAADVREAVAAMDALFPGFGGRFYDEHGALKGTIRIYVNKKDVRRLDGDRTRLADGDELILLPALSGG